MSRLRVAAAVAAVVLLGGGVAAFVSRDRGTDVTAGSGAGSQVGPPFEIVPLTAFAASPENVLVVASTAGGDKTQVSMLDVASQEWSEVPPPPFTSALFVPDVHWDGSTFVVVGSPCQRVGPDTGDVYPVCEPGGLELAVFSPAEATWSSLVTLDVGEGTAPGEVVGTYLDRAVLVEGGRFFTVDLATGASQELPRAPIPPTAACLIGEQLVVATRLDEAPRGASDINRFDPLAAATLALPTPNAWSAVVSPGVPYEITDTFSLECTGDGPLAVLNEAPDGDAPSQSYLYRPRAGRWEPSSPPPMPFGVVVASASTPSETTIWTNLVAATRHADGSWSVVPDAGDATRAATIDQRRSIVLRSQRAELAIEEKPT